MYQRKYYKDEAAMKIPDNYSGLAIDAEGYIDETAPSEEPYEVPTLAMPIPPPSPSPPSDEECGTHACAERRHGGTFYETIEGFCRRIGLHMPSFDREDILLIGVALFLFFSKDGDKECALLLIALLFLS